MEGFFFQAEDGIRDRLVTGVQTCALPIWGCVETLGKANGGFKNINEGGLHILSRVKKEKLSLRDGGHGEGVPHGV